MSKQKIILLMSILLLVFTGTPALAQESHTPYENMFNIPPNMLDRFANELGISKEQIDQIRQIRLKTLKKIIPLRADAEVKELELRESLAPREPNVDLLFKLTEEIGTIRIKMAKEWLLATLEMKKILSPEQMDRLLTAMEQFKKRFRHQRMQQKQFQGEDPAK